MFRTGTRRQTAMGAKTISTIPPIPAPRVLSLSPSSGIITGGTAITITGLNMAHATDVTVDGSPVSFTVRNAATITITAPAGAAAGPVHVRVTTAQGESPEVSGDQFTYLAYSTSLQADNGTFQDTARTTPAVADNDPVRGWEDQSGNNKHASEIAGGWEYLLKTAVYNNENTLRVDAQHSEMSVASLTDIGSATKASFNVVLNLVDGATNDNVIFLSTNGSDSFSLSAARTSSRWACQLGVGGFTGYVDIPGTYGALAYITLVFDGALTGNTNRLKMWVNGLQRTLTFTGTIPAVMSSATTLFIGGQSGSANFDGDLCQVDVIGDYAMTTDEVLRWHNNMIIKWSGL